MAIERLYKTRLGDDPVATSLLFHLARLGYDLDQVIIEEVLRVEFESPPSQSERDAMTELFVNPVIETGSRRSVLNADCGPIREISYRRAWTDPEHDSALHALRDLGVKTGITWIRLAKRFQLVGISEAAADEIASRYLYNKQIQLVMDGQEWTTLVPQGLSGPVEAFDVQNMDAGMLAALSKARRLHMSADQLAAMQAVFARLGRPARDGEIEMLAGYWSDHCAHTTFKSLGLLQMIQAATARIAHPDVVSAFVDNSGVMSFYGGNAICIKGETHISPTFGADPYGGIMTKHGGVIRDVIGTGQGAWPFAGTTIMATVDPRVKSAGVPQGAFHPKKVLAESIRGTYQYTNPMGIPMALATYMVDNRNWKGFALGHSIGVLPAERAQKGQPQPGDVVVLVGGLTGADGLHGATVSSGNMTAETSTVDAAHVQIGAPIEERAIMEVVPVLRDADCIRAITDCGAAGLSSACGEMGEGTGIWVNLAWVPLKSAGMRKFEIWISESQERMVLAIPRDKLAEAMEILRDYGVRASVIGVFTDTQSCQVVYDSELAQPWDFEIRMSGEIVVDLPYRELKASCPLPQIPVEPRPTNQPTNDVFYPHTKKEWVGMVQAVLGHYNISDQSEVAHRYDQTVQGGTVMPYMGGSDERIPNEVFVATPVLGEPWVAGFANAADQYYGDVDPAGQGRLVFAQAVTKLAAAGFDVRHMIACVNVYTPSVLDSPTNAWALKELVSGYVSASEALGVPVITGKDSSSGTFISGAVRVDAPLTVDVGILGKLPSSEKLIGKPFVRPSDWLVLYHPGLEHMSLGGSIAYKCNNQKDGSLPQVNLCELKAGLIRWHEAIQDVKVSSRSAITQGGLIRSIFECCLGGLGCQIDLGRDVNPMLSLFTELSGGILFSTPDYHRINRRLGKAAKIIGYVTAEPVIQVRSDYQYLFKDTVENLGKQWGKTFAAEVA